MYRTQSGCTVLCSLFISIFLALNAAGEPPSESLPEWIWLESAREPGQSVRLAKPFACEQPVVAAELCCGSESAEITVSIDGNPLTQREAYDPVQTIDLTEKIGVGSHELVVTGTSLEGPAAMFLSLELEFPGGEKRIILSNSDWSSEKGVPVKSFGRVDSRLIIPIAKRVGISALENYEQWKLALNTESGKPSASFAVTNGFEIDLVRLAAEDEGSWVSMLTDAQGRLLIAKEERGLLRMTLSESGDSVEKVETIDDTLLECRGLAFVGTDLYANANNSKGLYRLESDGNDGFKEPQLVFETSGGVGHGRNDLAVGPDGMIYSIHGDAVDIPVDVTDYTSPFRAARQGQKTSEGHVLRIDPRTGQAEVLVAGLRNPFGIDFNPLGDMFTYDADAEYDMGAPWYRPTRVSHLLIGGDYGWRGVTKSWPPYYPDHADNTRPNLDIGKGSPTAVKFGTRSDFPPRYRDALFILDWAYGRVLAIHAIPRGSSYLMTAETFLQGRPLNVTDLDFGSNGSMFLVTGGRKTQSALYRIRYGGERVDPKRSMSAQQRARGEFASQARTTCRQLLSQLQATSSALSPDRYWSHLSSADPWIAQAAIHLLERTPVAQWKERALAEQEHRAAIRSLLALARTGNTESFGRLVDRLNEIPLATLNRSEKLAALRAYWLCLPEQMGDSQRERWATVQRKLDGMYPDQQYEINQTLSELLVRLETPRVIEKTIRLLQATTDQAEQMHYLFVLRNVDRGWTLSEREIYFSSLQQADRFVAGAGMSEFIRRIREEAIETLSDHERTRLAPLLAPQPDLTVEATTVDRPFVEQWTVQKLLSSDQAARGDAREGAEIFAAARCNQCHRMAGRGRSLGPDLTAASRRFSREDLLKAIVDPSQVIAENYRSVQILTEDGKAHVGQIVTSGDYRSPQLRLATDPNRPTEVIEIDKSAIVDRKLSPISWMPEGLLDTFTRDEIFHLLAYLESSGGLAP